MAEYYRESEETFDLPSAEEDPNAYFRLLSVEGTRFQAKMKEWAGATNKLVVVSDMTPRSWTPHHCDD